MFGFEGLDVLEERLRLRFKDEPLLSIVFLIINAMPLCLFDDG